MSTEFATLICTACKRQVPCAMPKPVPVPWCLFCIESSVLRDSPARLKNNVVSSPDSCASVRRDREMMFIIRKAGYVFQGIEK